MKHTWATFFIIYLATPFIFIVGFALMYFLIGDHPHFWAIMGFYALTLALLYVLKLGILRRMMRKSPPQSSSSADSTPAESTTTKSVESDQV